MKSVLVLFGLAIGLAAANPVLPTDESAALSSSREVSPAHSIVLHDGTNWTIVPQGALIHVPKTLQTRIADRRIGNLMSWKEFLAANREWLGAESVSIRQAEGTDALSERRLEYFSHQGRMIVAVHSGAPIVMASGPESSVAQTAQLR